jgi:hypothetical protein
MRKIKHFGRNLFKGTNTLEPSQNIAGEEI